MSALKKYCNTLKLNGDLSSDEADCILVEPIDVCTVPTAPELDDPEYYNSEPIGDAFIDPHVGNLDYSLELTDETLFRSPDAADPDDDTIILSLVPEGISQTGLASKLAEVVDRAPKSANNQR